MGEGCPSYRCRWVRDRLPLLTGGELTGADRRKVERHLIACPGCRERKVSLVGALAALHAAAGHSPAGLGAGAEAPSLWPTLARQIREARHEPTPLAFPSLFSGPREWVETFLSLSLSLSSRPWRLAASVLIVASLAAAGVDAWSRRQVHSARVEMAAAARPLGITPVFIPIPAPIVPAIPGPSIAQTDASSTRPDRSVATARIDYDLDHGTPMGPDAHEIKASY
jgi:Putative zinc-finger